MSENLELLRRAFEAFNRGDVDAMVADMAPDCEYIAIGVVGATGAYRGPEGLKRLLSQLWDEFDDPRYEVHELIETGDRVLASVTLRGRGKQSGAETSWDIWQVWTVRDGKAVRGQGFTSREEALEAAGLEE